MKIMKMRGPWGAMMVFLNINIHLSNFFHAFHAGQYRNPSDPLAILDPTKKTRSLLDFKSKFDDMKPIFV